MQTLSKKTLANRLNSKKSTGPKSEAGKRRSSLNSIKHGLYGEKIAIIGENIDEINDITERLVKELKPIGINQEIIVSKMVDLAIRLRRIPLLEAGILNQEMQEYEAEKYKEDVAEVVGGGDKKTMMLSSNVIVRKSGLSFSRDCNGGSAILKLNTIEDKLLSKYFKLLEILKRFQKKKGAL
jgi:nitrogenase molybdenum-iron protein alpha/beta subunit